MQKQQIIGVLGLLVNEYGQVLLSRRNDKDDPQMNGLWQIPGGALEFGESPIETLHRELKEELGISDIEIMTLLPFVGSRVRKNVNDEYHIILICYLGKMKHKQPIVLNEEGSEYQWIDPGEIKKYRGLPFLDTFILEAEKFLKKTKNLSGSISCCQDKQ